VLDFTFNVSLEDTESSVQFLLCDVGEQCLHRSWFCC